MTVIQNTNDGTLTTYLDVSKSLIYYVKGVDDFLMPGPMLPVVFRLHIGLDR